MTVTLYQGDCLSVMAGMAANSIDLVAVDPPYYKVKDEPWDRQWDTEAGFLAWIGELCEQWQRILKPNGSLYCFASPRMAARVEVTIGERLNVLNHIIWAKPQGRAESSCKEALRCFFGQSERIIFAEHYGADNIAKGEAGYAAKCDELRGFVFEPLRAYLTSERDRASLTTAQVNDAWMAMRGTKGQMAGHWFERVQWALPTADNYQWLRATFRRLNHGGDYLRREYEDLRREYEDLRREYEDLRREYEDLRRPFSVTADVPYTDVWTFPTVSGYPGKHPCEKPLALMEHIVRASSREGATVLDCCMGSGTTGIAAVRLGRHFIGIDLSQHWVDVARGRIEQPQAVALPLPV